MAFIQMQLLIGTILLVFSPIQYHHQPPLIALPNKVNIKTVLCHNVWNVWKQYINIIRIERHIMYPVWLTPMKKAEPGEIDESFATSFLCTQLTFVDVSKWISFYLINYLSTYACCQLTFDKTAAA